MNQILFKSKDFIKHTQFEGGPFLNTTQLAIYSLEALKGRGFYRKLVSRRYELNLDALPSNVREKYQDALAYESQHAANPRRPSPMQHVCELLAWQDFNPHGDSMTHLSVFWQRVDLSLYGESGVAKDWAFGSAWPSHFDTSPFAFGAPALAFYEKHFAVFEAKIFPDLDASPTPFKPLGTDKPKLELV
jgi:hypothetical protein